MRGCLLQNCVGRGIGLHTECHWTLPRRRIFFLRPQIGVCVGWPLASPTRDNPRLRFCAHLRRWSADKSEQWYIIVCALFCINGLEKVHSIASACKIECAQREICMLIGGLLVLCEVIAIAGVERERGLSSIRVVFVSHPGHRWKRMGRWVSGDTAMMGWVGMQPARRTCQGCCILGMAGWKWKSYSWGLWFPGWPGCKHNTRGKLRIFLIYLFMVVFPGFL